MFLSVVDFILCVKFFVCCSYVSSRRYFAVCFSYANICFETNLTGLGVEIERGGGLTSSALVASLAVCILKTLVSE